MRAGAAILRAFSLRPGPFHAALATPAGWRVFVRICRGDTDLARILRHRSARTALALAGARRHTTS
jgi:hypothetical protein